MKCILWLIAVVAFFSRVCAQNVGIGVSNPARAKLEVWGVGGLGRTTGYFGDDRGISLQKDYPAIGINQYRDSTQYGRYMGNGHAAVWEYMHDDATQSKGLSYTIFPAGGANAVLPGGTKVWEFSLNNRLRILTSGTGINGILDVGRGGGVDGTAVFMGTNYWSHFNYGTQEHTYIRGGKISGNVYLNDIPNGNVIFGNGACTIGINTNYYRPPTTLEVRQSNGGMELTNASFPNLPMEWRVASGSNAHFYLYYNNSVRTYFNYVTGALHPVSDGRLKTNIAPLQPVLPRLMQLRPVSYLMKDAGESRVRSLGFLAQQVEPLFPVLVCRQMGDKNDQLGLNYNGFNVVVVKGIQEEEAQINELDEALREIDRRLQQVEQQITHRKL